MALFPRHTICQETTHSNGVKSRCLLIWKRWISIIFFSTLAFFIYLLTYPLIINLSEKLIDHFNGIHWIFKLIILLPLIVLWILAFLVGGYPYRTTSFIFRSYPSIKVFALIGSILCPIGYYYVDKGIPTIPSVFEPEYIWCFLSIMGAFSIFAFLMSQVFKRKEFSLLSIHSVLINCA